MNNSIDRPTNRPRMELGVLHSIMARGIDGNEHRFIGKLYTDSGPKGGTKQLAWSLAGPGYELIDNPPKTDALIRFSDGDFARIRLENPEDVGGSTYDERKANNNEVLRWSLTNVGMQADGEGIRLPADTVLSTELRVGERLTLRSSGWPNRLESNGTIESVFIYDRTKPADERVAESEPETSILEDFRQAVKSRIARQALGGSGN